MRRATQLKPGDVSLGQAYEFWKAFGKQGGTIEMAQRAIEDAACMSRMVDCCRLPEQVMVTETVTEKVLGIGFSYDATHLLGFGPACTEPLPSATPGEIIIRYGGWSYKDLRYKNSLIAERNLMRRDQDSYDQYPWSGKGVPPGIYRIRLPIVDSNRKAFCEQVNLLLPDEKPIPVVLAVTALLVHCIQTGEHLLKTDRTFCKEQTTCSRRVALCWDDGRLGFYCTDGCWDDRPDETIWLSSAQLLSSES